MVPRELERRHRARGLRYKPKVEWSYYTRAWPEGPLLTAAKDEWDHLFRRAPVSADGRGAEQPAAKRLTAWPKAKQLSKHSQRGGTMLASVALVSSSVSWAAAEPQQ